MSKTDYEILTENGAVAYDISKEQVLKQLWLIVDVHNTKYTDIYERYKKTIQNHKKLFEQFHQEVLSYVKHNNIRWLNAAFILIVRKRDYRNGGEGHKMFYYSLLFNFLDALYKADCKEGIEFYKYVASKLSNDYGCWKDLRIMYSLLENVDKIKENEEDINEYSINYENLIDFKEYCVNAFVEQLKEDIENYKQKKSITLCSKFAPTQNTDKKFARLIAKKIFKDSKTPDKDFRKILTELHTYGNVIEQFICCQKLNEFNPKYLTGCSKQFYKKQFFNPKSDDWVCLIDKLNKITEEKLIEINKINERLEVLLKEIFILQSKEILSDDEKKKLEELINEQDNLKKKLKEMKITNGAESANIIKLLKSIINYTYEGIIINKNPMNELMIEAIKAKLYDITKLDALCVCDTSGSMYGDPMSAALMLTYLISSTSSNLKFRNKFITFSREPKWLNTDGTIYNFAKVISENCICENTNIEKTIDLITSSIKDTTFNPKVIFFFTDGQFDNMTSHTTSCKDYIKMKFEEIGKETPLCIFWNLRNCGAIEAKSSDNGFILYSGFSQKQIDSLANGIFTFETEGKSLQNISTEDMIIQFIHSSFKDNLIKIMKTYNKDLSINGISILSNI